MLSRSVFSKAIFSVEDIQEEEERKKERKKEEEK